MRLKRLPAILVAGMTCWCATAGAPAYSQETTLWQIGTFDQSSEEFGLSFGFGALASAQPDPVYRVGQSDWKKDWSGFQPGSANGRAGGRAHPFTVIFSLAGRPRGLYKLTIAVLPYMPRRPNLRIDINGQRGLFYLRPHITYDLGNFPVAFIPQYCLQQLEIEIPTAYLREGENKLVITCVDDPPTPEDSYGTVGLGSSGIFYDALSLSQDAAKKFTPGEIQAWVTPTVFYQQKGGGLAETVEAVVRLNRKVPEGARPQRPAPVGQPFARARFWRATG